MANIIVADGQYETVEIDTTLVEVAGKLYYLKNTSVGNINITYGVDVKILYPNDLGIFMFDGTIWSDLTPAVMYTELNPVFDTVTVNGNITQTSGVTSLKATTIYNGLKMYNAAEPLQRLTVSVANADIVSFYNYDEGATLFKDVIFGGSSVTSDGVRVYGATKNVSIGGGIDNIVDLMQVGVGQNISAGIGFGRMGFATGGGSTAFYIGHKDSFTGNDFGAAFTSDGQSFLNASTGSIVHIQNNNLDIATFSGSAISLLKDTTITGSLSKSSGSFRIPHPLKEKEETHELVHSFVEAPQADNIYRGKVNLVKGKAVVNIDTVAGMTEGTFTALNREVQIFTTNESGWNMVRGSVEGNIITIEAQTACTDLISWMVIGERHDKHMYDTAWTDDDGKVIVEPEVVIKETQEN